MPDTLIDVPALLAMSQSELDETFRASPAAAKLIHLLAWKGKVFDPDRGELRNEVLLTGIRAVRAKVYKDASWYDQAECIVLDYSHTSLIAHWIRDEMRLVAPNLYLGIVFWDHRKLIDFVLRFPAADGG